MILSERNLKKEQQNLNTVFKTGRAEHLAKLRRHFWERGKKREEGFFLLIEKSNQLPQASRVLFANLPKNNSNNKNKPTRPPLSLTKVPARSRPGAAARPARPRRGLRDQGEKRDEDSSSSAHGEEAFNRHQHTLNKRERGFFLRSRSSLYVSSKRGKAPLDSSRAEPLLGPFFDRRGSAREGAPAKQKKIPWPLLLSKKSLKKENSLQKEKSCCERGT